MAKLSKKIIEAVSAKSKNNSEFDVGSRLQEIRKLAGLTQVELSRRMGIKQAALSKLENRDDVLVSTLKSYVNALDARLIIDAAFEQDSPVKFRIRDAFDLDEIHEDQFLLPIFEDVLFREKRDVVLSIKPQYAEPIIDGIKTVELRRRFPKNVPQGTFAYIYTTSPVRALTGLAEIKSVEQKSIEEIWKKHSKTACIKKKDFLHYFSGLDAGFVISFKNPVRLKRSIELNELRERFNFEPPQSFLYAKPHLREAIKYESAAISD